MFFVFPFNEILNRAEILCRMRGSVSSFCLAGRREGETNQYHGLILRFALVRANKLLGSSNYAESRLITSFLVIRCVAVLFT